MKILNYGSMNLDYVYRVPHFVKPGETLSAESRSVNCGGKGLNQSIALARAGAEVWQMGAVGAGDGEMLLEALRRDGVHTDWVQRQKKAPTGHALIQVDAAGENCILLFGGANQSVDTEAIDEALGEFSPGDYLILQNEVNGNREIMEKAHKKGMRIVLNPSPMNEKILSLPLEYVDWFMVNEVEAQALCGGSLEQMLERYPGAGIVLTQGSKGVKCAYAGQTYTHGIYRVPVRDTTAAGDTFCGFFIACLAGGSSIAGALSLASLASAIAVSRPGAQASIPYLKELETYPNTEYVEYRGI